VCDAELSRITEMTNESNASLCNGESNGSVCNGFATDAAGQCNDAHNNTNSSSSSSSSIGSKGTSNSDKQKQQPQQSQRQQQQQQSVLDNRGLCDVFDYRLHTTAASASDSNPWALNSSNGGFVINSSSSGNNGNNVNAHTAQQQQQQQQQQRNLFNTTASTNTGTATSVDRSEQWLADHEQFTLAVLNRLNELETAVTDLSDVTATSTRGSSTVNGMSLKAIMSAAAAAAHGLSSATAVSTASTTASSGISSCTQIAGLQPVVLHLLTVAQGLAVHLVEAERALYFKEMNMQSELNATGTDTATTATATAAIGDAEVQQQHTTEQIHGVNAGESRNWSSAYAAQSSSAAAAAAAVDTVSSSGSSGGVSRSIHSSSSGSSGASCAVSEHTAASSSSSYGLHCDEWSDALNSVERLLYPYAATATSATTSTVAGITASTATTAAAAVGSTPTVYSANKCNNRSSMRDSNSDIVYGTPQQQQQYPSSHCSNSNSTIDSGVHTGERYAVHTVTPDRDLFVFGTANTSSAAIDTTGSGKQQQQQQQQQQQYGAYADTSTHSSSEFQQNGYQNSSYSDDLYNEQHMVMLSERVSALQDRVHRVELDVDDRATVAHRLSAVVAPATAAAPAATAATSAVAVVDNSGGGSEQQLRQSQQRQLHAHTKEHAKESAAPASVRYIPHEEGDSCIMQPKSVLLHAPYKSPNYPLRNAAAPTTAATAVAAAAALIKPDENTSSYNQQQQQQHLQHYSNKAAVSVQQQWSAGKHSGSVSATSCSNGVKVTPDSRGRRAPLGEWYMPVNSTN
jgi:hypothetical protein